MTGGGVILFERNPTKETRIMNGYTLSLISMISLNI